MSEEWYPRFSEKEMSRRHAAAKDLMDEEGLDALLFFGLGGTNRNAQANIYWLSCYRDFNHCYLIFPKEGPPSLFTGLYNHLHNAQMQCIFETCVTEPTAIPSAWRINSTLWSSGMRASVWWA